MVEDEDNLKKMKFIGSEEKKKENEKMVKEKETMMKDKSQKEKEEYAEKVKEFTFFQIGRKLSKNTKKFNKEEIEEGKLEINDSALLRILTKWCEELKSVFKPTTIFSKEEPFRMMDGKEKHFSKR